MRQGFVTCAGEELVFDYHGRHRELLQILSPADIAWAAARWAPLTSAQWAAAFKAGGYAPAIADRYVRKLQEKIAQGLAVTGERHAASGCATSARAYPAGPAGEPLLHPLRQLLKEVS